MKENEIYDRYDLIRASGRIHWTGNTWLLTSYPDVEMALQNRLLSADRVDSMFPDGRFEFTKLAAILKSWTFFSDPWERKSERRAVWGILGPASFVDMDAYLLEFVSAQIRDWPGKEIDLVAQLSMPVRLFVLSQIFQIDFDEARELRELSDPIFSFITASHADASFATSASGAMNSLIAQLERVSQMKILRDSGVPMDSASAQIALLAVVSVFIDKAIANSLAVLLRDKEVWARIKSEKSLIPYAIREALRLESPTQITSRIALDNVMFRRDCVGKGQMLSLVIGAANRDPSIFNKPNEFQWNRDHSSALTFGIGQKKCPGEWISIKVATLVLNAMLDNGNLDFSAESLNLKWSDNLESRRLLSLTARFI